MARAVDGDRALHAAAGRLAATFATFIRTGTPGDPPWQRYRADVPCEKVFSTADARYR